MEQRATVRFPVRAITAQLEGIYEAEAFAYKRTARTHWIHPEGEALHFVQSFVSSFRHSNSKLPVSPGSHPRHEKVQSSLGSPSLGQKSEG
jgi:hypothetical protein